MKRLLLFLNLIVLPVVASGYNAAGNFGVDKDLWWHLVSETGVLTISKGETSTGEMEDFNNSSKTPWGYFGYSPDIKEIIIEDGVTSIGNWAFGYCTNLLSVTIPNSVTRIGNNSFRGCGKLNSVIIPNNVELIEDDTFRGCANLSSVTIPGSVTSIGSGVFQDCKSLVSVTLPNSIALIGNETFRGCSNLEYVIIPNKVTSIGSGVFQDCNSLVSVTLPNSLTSIQDRTFSGCSSLSFVTIPNSVIDIGSEAFAGCVNLSLVIPPSIKSMTRIFGSFSSPRNVIYLPTTAPSGWTAASRTYVPDKISYSSPYEVHSGYSITEMISFSESGFLYSGQAPQPTWTNNVNGYTATLFFPILKSEAGDHCDYVPVTFTNGRESFTTDISYRYKIAPAPLTITATNLSREYGDENPRLLLSYSGFVNGENESDLESAPTISTTATRTSDVGDYPITIKEGKASNYKFSCRQRCGNGLFLLW